MSPVAEAFGPFFDFMSMVGAGLAFITLVACVVATVMND